MKGVILLMLKRREDYPFHYRLLWLNRCISPHFQERAINEVKKLQEEPKKTRVKPSAAPRKKRTVKGKRKRGVSKWKRLIAEACMEAKAEDNDGNDDDSVTSTG